MKIEKLIWPPLPLASPSGKQSSPQWTSFSSVIDGDPLRFRGEVYHPYHFSCTACGIELTASAREVRTRPGYTANELVRTPRSHRQ